MPGAFTKTCSTLHLPGYVKNYEQVLKKEVTKLSKSNVIIFSHYFIKKRILEQGKIYQNEIVGECFECEGTGLSKESNLEDICISCDGTGTFYYGKENIN